MSDIWLIGLGVMGENLARNIATHNIQISVYNRTYEKTQQFLEKWYANITWYQELPAFISSLSSPKKVMIMVQAWKPVDSVIESILPYLSKWDIIIDLGNSFYKDTQRRYKQLQDQGISFVGCGVSGWEEWALHGPSMMPGWEKNAYKELQNIFESITAHDFSWGKCVSYIWGDGAGHFVKMIHNGIEYAIMQMMAEWYDILRKMYRLEAPEIEKIFSKYSKGKLASYLFDISVQILAKKDEYNPWEFLIDNILDVAWAKGTGLWTSLVGLESGNVIGTILTASQARTLSWEKSLRTSLWEQYMLSEMTAKISVSNFTKKLENALYAGMLIAYAQWLSMIQKVSKEENWDIDMSEITRIWQGGCIIRADILKFLTEMYTNNKNTVNILELPEIIQELTYDYNDFKDVLHVALDGNIWTPTLSSALNYFFEIISNKGSANFIQALRDYFWAHTYRRTDREWVFHSDWN